MRISDWSSDVCSSDLRIRQSLEPVIVIGGGSERHGDDGHVVGVDGLDQRDTRVRWKPATVGDHPVVKLDQRIFGLLADLELDLPHADAGLGPAKLGRAAWRERVCLYV